MIPENFLEFAKAINKSSQFIIDEETDSRTGIDLAQYYVFLECREEIGKKLQSLDPILAKRYHDCISGKINLRERSKVHGIIPNTQVNKT